MRSFFVLALAAHYARAITAQNVNKPIGDALASRAWTYDPVTSDEFDGSATMDSKWAQQMEGWIGTAPSFFQEGNAAIDTSKNILNLKTIYEEGKEPENVTCDCGFMDVTAPLLTSVEMVKYGYFEVRAKFANAELFSAFWLQGHSGEINVLEAQGSTAQNNYHCFDQNSTSNTRNDVKELSNLDPNVYNTYGLDWNADGITYYINGDAVRSVASSAGCFDQPMHVIFSVDATENTPKEFSSYTSSVRYFRRWTPTSPTAAPTAAPTAEPTVAPTAPPTAPPTAAPTATPTVSPSWTEYADKLAASKNGVCGKGMFAEQMERGSCKTAKNDKDGTNTIIGSEKDCLAAAKELDLEFTKLQTRNTKTWQTGCLVATNNKLYWNKHSGKESYTKSKMSICCTVIPEPACGASASSMQVERGSCMIDNNNGDNSLSHIRSEGDCLTAAKELGLKCGSGECTKVSNQRKSNWQKGCLQVNNKLYFNKHGTGKESYHRAKISICCQGPPLTVCGEGASPMQVERGSCLTETNNENDISLSHIETSDLCLAAAKELSFDFYKTNGEEKLSNQDKSTWPTGCLVANNKLYWNKHSGKESNTKSKMSICCKSD